MKNMMDIIDILTKENDSKKVSKLIIDTVMDERIENIEDIKYKYLIKSFIYATRAFCDKGMKAKAHMLAQEYYAQEDLDGNGLIYGLDFIYENPPIILEEITKQNKEKVKKNEIWKPIRKRD